MSSSGRPDAPAEAPDGPKTDAFDRWRYAGVFLLLFLFGTETFIVSPLLPTISGDIGVSETAAAQSVTAYVLVYAVTAPFLGLLSDRFAPGTETMEAQLYAEHEIPWEEIAFRTVKETLERYFADRRAGLFRVHEVDLV